jgi:PKD repeat protein
MSHKFLRYSSIPVLTFMLLGALLSAFDVSAAGGPPPVVRYATRSDATGPLRDMPQIPPMPAVLGQIFQRPFKRLPNRAGSGGSAAPDPVAQTSLVGASAPSTGTSFEGVGNVNGVLPPDPAGAIGPNHYVQMVNLSFAIYERDGNKLYGPAANNTLWQGFGGACESTNDGDPVVLYDHLADRWLMSQFALPNFPRGPFYQCIAVSKTGDPTGAWYRYEFTISDTNLNDYPKFGVWPDGYYMSINQFKCNPVRCSWAGQGVAAFERDQMLNGRAARMVFFDLYNADPNLGGMLPADLDGPAPPAGTPNPFAQVDDDAWGYTSQDQLQIWDFHVDWSNPSSSTFTFDRALQTAAFDANMCGYARNCIPQPGGTSVDAISDRLMYRLQYRDFGDYQTMVVNHTVDTDGSDHAGIRWYELRESGSGWGIAQQGTYAPDSDHRWMGSAAINGAGDIALGYSVSSGSTNPSIRFAGRLAGDPLGEMTQGEGVIVAGKGYQTHSSGRWGDYSMLSVDPTDDCTFWYTQEYYASVGSAPWRTRIGSFQLSDCSGTADNPPSVSITSPSDGAIVSGTVSITADASDDNGVDQVEFFVDNNRLGTDADGSDGWSASWDTTGASEGSHTVSATATDTAGQTASDSVGVTVDNVNDPPVASFTYSCTGLSCDFDASGSSDPDGSITNYAWNFGDGGTASGVAPSHTYNAGGTYAVTLTVTDDRGGTDSDSQELIVSQAAEVTVTGIDPDNVAAGATVGVTIAGTGFQPGAVVSFENGSGPAPSAIVTSVSADGTSISATITAKVGGPPRDRVWDVRVTNPDGSTGALPAGFTVIP